MPTSLRLLTALLLVPAAADGQAAWTIDPEASVDISALSASGQVNFGLLTAATRLGSGELIIADASAPGLAVFSPDGALRTRSGRAGAGPGEFRMLWWMGQCGQDSLWVHDLGLQRLSLFTRDGRFVRQVVPTQAPGLVRCGASGHLALLTVGDPPPPVGTSIRPKARLLLIRPHHGVTELRGEVPATEIGLVDFRPVPAPLARSAVLAVVGDETILGTADSAVLERIGPDGGTRGYIRLPYVPRRPTPGEVTAAIRSVLGSVPAPVRGELEPLLHRVPPPERLPPYFGLWSDPSNHLWVLRTPPGASPTEFTVVALDGTVLATARSAQAFTPLEVGEDTILGSREDADGDLHLVVLPVRRP